MQRMLNVFRPSIPIYDIFVYVGAVRYKVCRYDWVYYMEGVIRESYRNIGRMFENILLNKTELVQSSLAGVCSPDGDKII